MTAPIALKVTRWQCPACRRTWAKKARAAEHAARCWLNPANRSCKTCVHRIEPDSQYGYDTEEGCRAGVELERDPAASFMAILPIHCPKWESDGTAAPNQEAS